MTYGGLKAQRVGMGLPRAPTWEVERAAPGVSRDPQHRHHPSCRVPTRLHHKLRVKDETLSNSKAVTAEHGPQPHPSVDRGYTPMKLT